MIWTDYTCDSCGVDGLCFPLCCQGMNYCENCVFDTQIYNEQCVCQYCGRQVNGAYGILIDKARTSLNQIGGSSYRNQMNFNPNFNPNFNYQNKNYFNSKNQYKKNGNNIRRQEQEEEQEEFQFENNDLYRQQQNTRVNKKVKKFNCISSNNYKSNNNLYQNKRNDYQTPINNFENDLANRRFNNNQNYNCISTPNINKIPNNFGPNQYQNGGNYSNNLPSNNGNYVYINQNMRMNNSNSNHYYNSFQTNQMNHNYNSFSQNIRKTKMSQNQNFNQCFDQSNFNQYSQAYNRQSNNFYTQNQNQHPNINRHFQNQNFQNQNQFQSSKFNQNGKNLNNNPTPRNNFNTKNQTNLDPRQTKSAVKSRDSFSPISHNRQGSKIIEQSKEHSQGKRVFLNQFQLIDGKDFSPSFKIDNQTIQSPDNQRVFQVENFSNTRLKRTNSQQTFGQGK